MTAFLLIAALVILAVVFFARRNPEKSSSWLQFYSKGKEAGFSMKDLDQIKRMASDCGLENPASVFVSQKSLEICIKAVVKAVRMSGESEDTFVQDLLSKLFDFYKQTEIKKADEKSTITNSRQISEGQILKVLLQGTGIFKSEVIKNAGGYLTISRPVNPRITSATQWNGMQISVYFWREDDAGYVFDTFVVDEVYSKGISSLKVEHNDSLFRTQKRKSLRLKLNKPAFVYLVSDADPFKPERQPGLLCKLEDISDTGCAFKVRGQAPVGQRLKLQFSLNRIPVCMPGTIRSAEFDKESNTSLLRMESDILPIQTRNRIFCEIFDMLPDEDDEELPFRVIEEEADNSKSAGGAEFAAQLQEVNDE